MKIIRLISFFFLVHLPLTLQAEAEKALPVEAFSFMNVLNMVMGLVVVISLILGLAWVLKKYGGLPNKSQADMKVLGGLSLGTREKALLIEVENTRLLIGVTPGHIQTLHILQDKNSPSDSTQPDFSETLNKISEQSHDE